MKLSRILSKAENLYDITKPVLSITKNEGLILQTDRFKKQIASVDKSKYKVVRHNQLVLSIHLDEGVLAVLNKEMPEGIVSPAYKIYNINNELVDNDYLVLLLKSESSVTKFKIKANSSVAGRCNVSEKDLLNFEFNIPPLNIQKTIVANINNLKNKIKYFEILNSKYDEIIKSQFIEMFGNKEFEMQPLSLCCDFIDYRGKTPEKSDSGFRLFTAKNVRMHKLNFEPEEFIPIENYEKVMTRGIPKSGTLLFTTEAPLGNICRIPEMDEKFCLGQRILNIIPKEYLNAIFLEYEMTSEQFNDEMLFKSSGTTVTGIRVKELVKIKVRIPNIQLQNKFADFVQQIDKSKFIVQKQIKLLEELLEKKMNEYFGN